MTGERGLQRRRVCNVDVPNNNQHTRHTEFKHLDWNEFAHPFAAVDIRITNKRRSENNHITESN